MNARRGFTLIELLIVIAIIGLLASVVLIGLGTFRATGRDARRVADVRQVQNALELYFSKCGFYPGSALCAANDDSADGAFSGPGQLQVVLETSGLGIVKIPNDPLTGTGDVAQEYFYWTNDTGGASIEGTKYILRAKLEDANNKSLKDDIDGNPPADFPAGAGGADCSDNAGVAPDANRFYCVGI